MTIYNRLLLISVHRLGNKVICRFVLKLIVIQAGTTCHLFSWVETIREAYPTVSSCDTFFSSSVKTNRALSGLIPSV